MTEVCVLAEGLGFTEGPLAVGDGTVWVTSITTGMLHRIGPDGSIVETVDVGGGPNGLALAADGTVYVAQNGGAFSGLPGVAGGIQCVRDGVVERVLTGTDTPNDLCFGPDGRLYFTDPRAFPDKERPSPLIPGSIAAGRLYACDRDGANLELLWEGPHLINGLAFGTDDDELFVAETCSPHRLHRASFTDGRVGEFEEFFALETGWPDGFAIASDGSFWVGATSDQSVHVYDRNGSFVRRIFCGEGSSPTNVCFGIGDDRHLYVAASRRGALLRIPTDVTGLRLHG